MHPQVPYFEDQQKDMAVLYLETGEAVTGIKLCSAEDNKCKLLMAIIKYFKER